MEDPKSVSGVFASAAQRVVSASSLNWRCCWSIRFPTALAGDNKLRPLTDGGREAESGEVEEQKLARRRRLDDKDHVGGDGGNQVLIDHQGGLGTRNLTGHGGTEWEATAAIGC
jgi:hypothetical protein